jgi:amidase
MEIQPMIGSSRYQDLDGLGLAELVKSRKASPQELLDEALARARDVEPAINSLSQIFPDRARSAIAAGLPDGPFHGVPFLVKDVSVSLKGTPTLNGSRLCRNVPPADQDSTIVERFKRAGIAIFGKTTTPEFGIAASTETSLTGVTHNPWDLSRTTGGSSGGAAAAVAARIVPMAHGSDGGGSIRTPASACGLFGLKPTRARNPSGPLVGEGWGSLAAHHVLTRSVRDSAAMLDCTHGLATGDPYCAPVPARPFLEEVGSDPGPLRVALQLSPFSGVPVHPECVTAARNAAKLLENLGHHVEEARPEVDWGEIALALWVLVATNIRATVKLFSNGRVPEPDEIDHVTREAFEFAGTLDAEAYLNAQRAIHRHGRRMAAFHETYDVLINPTLAQPPVPLGPQHTNNPDIANYRTAIQTFAPFTSPFNMSGQPSMSMPLHWTAEGLPIGVMASASFGNEALLFRVASQLELAQPWAHRSPTLPGS